MEEPGEKKSIAALDLAELPVIRGLLKFYHLNRARSGRGTAAKSLLFGELAEAIRQGAPLDVALELSSQPVRGAAGPVETARKLAGYLHPSVQAGLPLSGAMLRCSPAFNLQEIRMVEAGEQWGSLPGILKRVAQYQSDVSVMRALSLYMRYPLVVGIVMFSLLAFTFGVIYPKCLDIAQQLGARLPAPAPPLRFLTAFAGWGLGNWRLILCVVVVLVGGALLLMAWLKGAARWSGEDFSVMVSVPFVGRPYLRQLEACWLAALVSGIEAGVPEPDALRAAGRVCGGRLSQRSEQAARAVEQGYSIGDACLSRCVLRPWMNHRLQLVDWRGRFPEGLRAIAEDADEDARTTIVRFCKIAEAVALLLFALMTAGTVLGIYSLLLSFSASVP